MKLGESDPNTSLNNSGNSLSNPSDENSYENSMKELCRLSCKKLGKYKILQTLGSGSFSKTKLGIDTETLKYVAIKILHDDISESALKTIITEINALKQLKYHPNIISLYDFDQQVYEKASSNE